MRVNGKRKVVTSHPYFVMLKKASVSTDFHDPPLVRTVKQQEDQIDGWGKARHKDSTTFNLEKVELKSQRLIILEAIKHHD